MTDHDQLHELAEGYLKNLVSDVSDSLSPDFDSFAPFGELGIDSFYVLKIIKNLEADFGALPKTLLFENFNVNDLACYFVDGHRRTLEQKFSDLLNYEDAAEPGDAEPQRESADLRSGSAAQQAAPPQSVPGGQPVLVPVDELHLYPELDALVVEIFDRYKNEGSVSRGTRNIAPNLFIGGERRAYFNYSRCGKILLVYSYTGPEDHFPVLAEQIRLHCTGNGLELNILADLQIQSIGETPFSATPFGAIQRIKNLPDFTLQGGKMRRLRYQVSKFEKNGECRTEEYICGTDPGTDRRIVDIIDQWCSTRAMVNPLVYDARKEILKGSLSRDHRLFLTYVDDVLHNVILISPLCPEQNGYLMDLEFYTDDMPLGGLEFAIVKIIDVLVAEGCTMLSLGATLGPKLAHSSNADPQIDRVLDGLREKNIFNDEGNLQFKNKFRPENKTIYLCRATGEGNADSLTDLIMMIADPAKMQAAQHEHHYAPATLPRDGKNISVGEKAPISGSPADRAAQGNLVWTDRGHEVRSAQLFECGFNPLSIPGDKIDIDLKTDSWAELEAPSVKGHASNLRARLHQPADLDSALKQIFPFSRFVFTGSGRAAEALFYNVWQPKGAIPQNLLFPTAIFHQIDQGFEPVEFPHASAFDVSADFLFKGNLDWQATAKHIEKNHRGISLACVEVQNNAVGGYPVSLEHLRELKRLLKEYSIPLVVDGTRIVENACFIIEHESGYSGKTVWQVVREILSQADIVIASLTKDFGIDKGGLIATNDPVLYEALQDLAAKQGDGLDAIDKKLIALALEDRRRLETRVRQRMDRVRLLWEELHRHGVPVVHPAGGHCVVVDIRQIPEFAALDCPVPSFLAWLYLNTGIRAAGHNAGQQKNTPLNQLVRLAIPVGMPATQRGHIAERIAAAFKTKQNIPDLAPCDRQGDPDRSLHRRYVLKGYVNATPTPPSGATDPAPTIEDAVPNEARAVSDADPARNDGSVQDRKKGQGRQPGRPLDIAVIGMAGRYPKANTLNELWQNLLEGRDCIDVIPEARYGGRWDNGFIDRYRGGFIDDVDKFDSLFFNISPREAEMLDPQERLFLEVAWEAIEDAGYYPETMAGEGQRRDVGVFVGAVWAMYQMLGVEEKIAGNEISPNSFLWSIANRVSYWMDFSGPSLALDTACSSSLTAVYLACEAISKGDCSAAIVGGVNLDLHQSKLDINTAAGTQSEDGVCRSFGAGANGYVAGEGVGAIVVKPLERAVQDRDNIHGVIKSVVVNHGGRTSGYSVPSPKAQAALISSALERAGIDARTIGYVEAHGTGTELGDPIEISGLTDAFKSYQVKNQSCAIGSIKSNIGHLEAAAGVVSMSKVLLQMKKRHLVPSLHSNVLNEHIDFESSPFYVEQRVEPWREIEVDGVRHPLRAGISSFGAGGSNAHVILEDYQYGKEPAAESTERVFPLSARNEAQLKKMAARLREYLEGELSQSEPGPRLENVAYTLQFGRKSFERRVAVIARTGEQLIERLGKFVDGVSAEHVITGNAKNSESITKFLSKKEKAEFVELLLQGRSLHKTAQAWADGLLGDWSGLETGNVGRRVSLPTYPFDDKRHWARDTVKTTSASIGPVSDLHPLIDSNESTFERQLFRKTFTDRQFFIYDHLVSDIPTLPGVAYLELARKAGDIAAGRRVRRIQNIIWVSPLTVESRVPTEAVIDLKPNGKIVQFEVFTQQEGERKQLYSQGRLTYATEDDIEHEPEFIDLDSIRRRCTKIIEGREAYPLFKNLGLNLGPSFQVLQDVYKGDEEVLGELKIPDVRAGDFDDFILHPSLVDGSFQAGMAAAVGEAIRSGTNTEMFVPYSIGEVEVLHPLEPSCYSYVTQGKQETKGSAKLARSDVLIVNRQGKVLVKIRDTVGVPLTDVHEKDDTVEAADEQFNRLYYRHIWEKAAPIADPRRQDLPGQVLFFDADDRLFNLYCRRLEQQGKTTDNIILVTPATDYERVDASRYRLNVRDKDHYTRLFESLVRDERQIRNVCFAWCAQGFRPEEEFLREALQKGVHSLLLLCQSLIEQRPDEHVRLVYLYAGQAGEAQPHNEAVNGFAKTLQLEHPKLNCRVVEVGPEGSEPNHFLDAVVQELQAVAGGETAIRYDGSERYARALKYFELDEIRDRSFGEDELPLKEQGVYLITGGAGGLGFIFAGYLARHCRAKIVLTGRSELTRERQAMLDELSQSGAEVIYSQVDVSRYDQVEKLVDESRSRFGGLDGVIHSAGVLQDSYIKKKSTAEMDAVFAPKVYGTLNLDEATRNENLDFFVLFSSLAAVGGNVGQCDYSYANHFMDSYARRRSYLQAGGKRTGKTLSLNWSLWADGGMSVDEQTELFFRKNMGIKPIDVDTGLEAFREGIRSTQDQFAVLEGVRDKIEKVWGLAEKEKPVPAPSGESASETPTDATPAGDNGALIELVQEELSGIIVDFLKVDPADIDLDKILLDLGFDSIGLASFANSVNERYLTDLTPVVFFEYPSVREVSKYLVADHRNEVLEFHRPGERGQHDPGTPRAERRPEAEQAENGQLRISKDWNPGSPSQDPAAVSPDENLSLAGRFAAKPVAIVGMSGVMPQSDDLEEFWENLRDAKDLITVIPEDRWNWQDYDGDPLKETNKSNSKWGGFIREVDKFDPLFFGISPREAEMMDPQQRIFLETVWKAVEDSGQKVSDLSGTKTGLFVGAATNDYADVINGLQIPLDGYTASGNSHSVLVNRISFLLNLRGPSAPIDTACSSSLIALHRALESIHTGSSDMAIVGGVQVMLTPAGHISFGAAGMLSDDGRCKTFDKSANGYVRGEGSGAIFLKLLSEAESDGNNIYAVIRATAENHGGRVTALTAPNPNAQAELLVEAYEKADVDPTTVGYIECHGTGTSLGDPIEIQALKKSFAKLYKKYNRTPGDKPHCGLSSVKTNIGHLETAAGISGLLKVLLAIKHRQIPASLHFEQINPYINLEKTPFYVVDKTREWEQPRDESGAAVARRAGISSFGFGGANAHVVLEEYIDSPAHEPVDFQGPCLVVLSAKNEDRLKAYAHSMLLHIEKYEINPADFAYTLQVGRDAMPARLGLIADSINQVIDKLQAYVNGQSDIHDFFRGDVKGRNVATRAGTGDSHDGDAQQWVSAGEYSKLLQAWVEGLDFDWTTLYGRVKPKRLSLPTYPFARERCWFEVPENPPTGQAGGPWRPLHPLLHVNTSTLHQPRYSTTLTGGESFLLDHRIRGRTVLPPVVLLEMARAAVEISSPERRPSDMLELYDITWLESLDAPENRPITVELAVDARDRIEYEICSGENAEEQTVHCRGRAGFGQYLAADRLDIARLKERMHRRGTSPEQIYARFDDKGINCGSSYQTITALYQGEGELLADLGSADAASERTDGYILHPGVMYGAFQAAACLVDDSGPAAGSLLVSALDSLRVISACTDNMSVWVRCAENGSPGLDIDMCDAQGYVCIQMKGAVLERLPAEAGSGEQDRPHGESAPEPESSRSLFYEEQWLDKPPTEPLPAFNGSAVVFADSWFHERMSAVDTTPFAETVTVKAADRYRRLDPTTYDCRIDEPADIQAVIDQVSAEHGSPVTVICAWAQGRGEDGVHALFDLFKAVHESRRRINNVTLVGHYDPDSEQGCWDYAWIGFQRSLRLLLPDVSVSLLYSPPGACTWDQVLDARQSGGVVWHESGRRRVLGFEECAPPEEPTEPVLKEHGGYLITGGAGGLGLKLAHYLASQCRARLLLVGRRPLSTEIDEQLDRLTRAGAEEAHYRSVDITDDEALDSLARNLPFSLSGIIHAAGIDSSRPYHEKSRAEINRVLRPKTRGSPLLDQAMGNQPLDFVCYFSSSSAMLGDFGSCDYAIANRFQMAYGRHRRLSERSKGRTVVINWPLWRDGGMGAASSDQTAHYLKSSGQQALDSETGMALWHNLLAADRDHTLVMMGRPSRVAQSLHRLYNPEPPQASTDAPDTPAPAVKGPPPRYQNLPPKECIVADLKRLISERLKIAPDKLDLDTNLADYGFDSVGMAAFAQQLSEYIDIEIAPALFFSYATIEQLSDYFVDEHAEHLDSFYRRSMSSAQPEAPVNEHATAPPARRPSKYRGPSRAERDKPSRGNWEPIAVIGMAGRFPKANTVDELWTLLSEGESGIDTVPRSRWDWRRYYVCSGNENNKMTTNKGGFVEGVDEFDPLFFEVSPRDAELMDPGVRLLLMEAYHAIEDAGIDPSSLRGSNTGVFVGMEESQYGLASGEQGVTTGGNAMVSSRLSYYLDLHGPAIATNTACSSGLVALHQACTSLRQSECSAALVSGIALTLSPVSYIKLSQAGMLSPDGQCRAFSNDASGIGVGEAVVVVMLKRLSDAVAAGDNIYGTIAAGGVNFDGKTNGVTAPNGKMQADLIEKVYTDADIDIRSISHIVAHGTGTRLGDPVEIDALSTAFKKIRNKRGLDAGRIEPCAITSCKSNLGHTMAASGLVSVVGLLKGMQNREIPPSLHCEYENDYIVWRDSGLFVNKQRRKWETGAGRPRVGAVSSFGRSGTNAHIVLEEYTAATDTPESDIIPDDTRQGAIVPLSARTAEQLKQKSRDLADFLQSAIGDAPHPETVRRKEIGLHSLAYTLQVGREAMDERLAFVAVSTEQLLEKLCEYVNHGDGVDGVYRGAAAGDARGAHLLAQDEEIKGTVLETLTVNKNLDKLAKLWVEGVNPDWNKLYGKEKPARVRLPLYPFAGTRHWVGDGFDATPGLAGGAVHGGTPVLHPMVHSNTSDLSQQTYSSVFRGDELFTKIVQDGSGHSAVAGAVEPGASFDNVLSEVAYLEMARYAVEQARPTTPDSAFLELHNIHWFDSFSAAEGKQINIALYENGSEDDPFEQIDYEFYSAGPEGETLHCQGQAVFVSQPRPAALDLEHLTAHMSGGLLDAASVHSVYASLGIDGAPAFDAVYRDHDQLVAKITSPAARRSALSDCHINPVLLDGVLAACTAFVADANRPADRPATAKALRSMMLLSPCTDPMYVRVRFSEEDAGTLDVDLFDDTGGYAALIRGLLLESGSENTVDTSESARSDDTAELTMLVPRWDVFDHPLEPSDSGAKVLVIGASTEHVDILRKVHGDSSTVFTDLASSDSVQAIVDKLREHAFDRVIWIAPYNHEVCANEESIITGQSTGIVRFLKLVKSLISMNYGEQRLTLDIITTNSQVVSASDIADPTHSALKGFSGSLANEYPRWSIRYIDAPGLTEELADGVRALPASERGAVYAYRHRQWLRQTLIPVRNTSPEPDSPYRNEGVYVVIGGAGGLGEVWTRHVITRARAQVIWIGRRELNSDIQAKLDDCASLGKRPEYIQADAADFGQLRKAYREIKKKHCIINGVIHSAIGEFDKSIQAVDPEAFRSILSVKVDVSVRIAQIFKNENLDFVLFFSSGASFARSAGMSGYSAGCAFKDAFAVRLAGTWRCPVKTVNWGYWGVGTGNTISDSMKALVHQSGQRPIEPGEGMTALDRLIVSGFNQAAIVKTVPGGKYDLPAASDESITSLPPPTWSHRIYAGLNTLENTDLPHELKTIGDRDAEDMDTLVYQLLERITAETSGITDGYTKWLKEAERLLEDANRAGLMPSKTGPHRSTSDLWRDWDEARPRWIEDPKKKAACVLVDRCLRALPDILTGKKRATEVIFPGSSLELVEAFYTSPISKAYNQILVDALVAAVKKRLKKNPSARLRIMEVGAGTGATTVDILRGLKPFEDHIAEYCYTDVSKAFLFQAQKTFAASSSYLRTELFDVTRAVEEQSITPHRYDFVIAANVLHATPNIRETLKNVKAALNHSGMLILNEVSQRSVYGHVIFGLLDGWWLNEDSAVRIPGSPALYPEMWNTLLSDEGFNTVTFPCKSACRFGQQIILAVSDGIVRHRETADSECSRTAGRGGSARPETTARVDLEAEA